MVAEEAAAQRDRQVIPSRNCCAPGLDESSRFLTEARVELLDPVRRQKLDAELAAQAEEEAIAEFNKYLAFALNDKTLRPPDEEALLEFGRNQGLSNERMLELIEAELVNSGSVRVSESTASQVANGTEPAVLDPNEDFMRMLRLSGLDADEMTDDQRDALINMAENLGIDPGDAEDMVDLYLEEIEKNPAPVPPKPILKAAPPTAPKAAAAAQPPPAEAPKVMAAERPLEKNFTNGIGGEMRIVPGGVFQMGSKAPGCPAAERPITQVTLDRYYISRHPITNAQYEMFDPSHARKRAPAAGGKHPVVYVSSVEAAKFCQWLSSRERRRYRLPTEAEWEFAARGTDNRKYPWGNHDGRGDLANFADRNTVFAWSDRKIDDGFAESSPVGAFPRSESLWRVGYGGKCLGMVPRLPGGLSRNSQDQPARGKIRREAGLSGRQLEISLPQPAGHNPRRQRPELLL